MLRTVTKKLQISKVWIEKSTFIYPISHTFILKGSKDCLTKATTYFAEQGKFSMAAKYQKEIAEFAESAVPPDYNTAIQAYQIAADYYESENSPRYLFIFY